MEKPKMDESQPTTGYLLIETEYISDKGEAPQGTIDDANIAICREIRRIVKDRCGYVRGAVVDCKDEDKVLYHIIVSLEVEDEGIFDEIAGEIDAIAIKISSEGRVKKVIKAKDKQLPTGFQGPP
jgi:hypothetical protein